MPLKYELDNLDGVPDPLKEHYVKVEETGKYVLGVEGVVQKERLDEFRDNNIKLVKERDELKNVLGRYGGTPEEIAEIRKTIEGQKDKKILDDEGVEALVASRLSKLVEDHTGQVKGKDKVIGELNGKVDQTEAKYRRLVIDRAVSDAALKGGVRPAALTDVLLRAQQIWTLDERERPVAKIGGEVQYGKDGVNPMSALEWIESLRDDAPHFFEPSGGGGASGANGAGGLGKDKTKSKSDLKSPADKAKFIREHGYDAFVALPAA